MLQIDISRKKCEALCGENHKSYTNRPANNPQDFTIYISKKFKAHMDANGNKAREIATADHIGIQHDVTFVFNAEVSKQLVIGFHVMLCSKTCCRDYMYSLCGTLSLLPNPYEYCQISMHMKVSKTSVRIYTQ